MQLSFVKAEGTGNDFIIVDAEAVSSVSDLSGLVKKLCARKKCIGADGVLIYDTLSNCDFKMRIFNPDGSEVEMCGNGIRCFAALIRQSGYTREKAFLAETIAGVKALVIEPAEDGLVVTVDMGAPSFAPKDIPAMFDGESILRHRFQTKVGEWEISCVSTGTAHTVVFVDALPDDSVFVAASGEIERHPLFPEGTSVMWVAPESRELVNVRIWERGGVGESLACGTGACAVMAVGRKLGFLDSPCAVRSKGGELRIAWDGRKGILMTGPAVAVYEGEWAAPDRRR